ncbi:MAG: Ig-like domain-containing protein [Acidimicrobiales bacterium]
MQNAATSTPTVTLNPAPPAGGYTDQQLITVSVGPNSLFSPGQTVNVLECNDPGGSPANLPTDVSSCDGATIQPTTLLANADGSFTLNDYQLFELPNLALGENNNPYSPARCDRSNPCVLYVGMDQNDFTQPKVFSAPFTIGSPSTTTVSSSAPASPFSQNVTLTAAVAINDLGGDYAAPATGTVSFASDGSPISGCQNVTLASQSGQCVVAGSALGGGTHTITAVYSGDTRADGSTGSATQEITGAPTALAAQAAILQTSPVGLNLYTLNATLTSQGKGVAGQKVAMSAGGSPLCSAVTNSAGLASCSILTNATGILSTVTASGYTATFGGTTDWLPSTANAPLIG